MKDHILERLKAECPFSQVFEDLERGEDGLLNVPAAKSGTYVRTMMDTAGGTRSGPATRP